MTDVKSKQKSDLTFIAIFAITIYTISSNYDFEERLDSFCDMYERYEIDEILVVALLLIPVSMLYFLRRWLEIRQANQRLGAALAEIEHLRGIIPICCSCKKIRDDAGYWHEVETYFKNNLDTSFTHGICNDCIEALYPDQHQKMVAEEKLMNNGATLNDQGEKQ